ncbi:hypothetical protein D5086_026517 [Populus alba]|uniref:Uncharacterized protein n=1 Tax=Populus alba TaxID=43335 RepID=A0ACC4B3T0_POPAL
MVFCFLRSYRFTEATWEAFSLPNFVFRGVCHPGIFKPMRGIKVKGSSSVRTLVSDGESHVQPMPLVEEETGSSSSVQSTPEIEKNYVHRVYDAIAPHFSSTRFAKWPKVATFLNSLPSGSLVLDAGCGNGKYLGFNPDCTFVGCDISGPLIKICADRGHEVLVADAVNLPYRTGFGDAAISIAVLHHLSTENRRKRAIDELVRAVKKGGLILITVWAVEQEDRSLVTKWTPLNQNGASACALENGLAKKDDKKGAVVYNRYYHVFSEGELERLVSGMNNAVVVDRFFDKSNWCIILQKTL